MGIDTVLWSRLVTGLTLGFHVIFATIGVGVPLMIAIAEFMGIRKKDAHYTLMAKRWARGFVISVAVGVVTGTAISLQLALVWPNFMKLAGNVIALPLFMEVFAFFLRRSSWAFISIPGTASKSRISTGSLRSRLLPVPGCPLCLSRL